MRTNKRTLIVSAACILCILFITVWIAGLVAKWEGAAEANRRVICASHLKRLGVALRQYSETYGVLPSPAIVDSNGEELLSWRVLLLPFLGEDSLYRQFRLDEPWNSQHNLSLLPQMPPVFRCPAETEVVQTTTNYVAIVGQRTAFPPGGASRLTEITDDVRTTVLLVEVGCTGIPWTQPRDLLHSELPPSDQLASPHLGLRNVLFCNGWTIWVSQNLSPNTWAAIMTTQGGEPVDLGDL